MYKMSQVRKDFIATHLRCQIKIMLGLLEEIENNDERRDGYENSFRALETNIRQIKKLCLENN